MGGMRHVKGRREMRVPRIVLIGNPEGKGPLGRHTRRWEGHTSIILKEEGIRMETFPGSSKHGNKPLGSIKRGQCFDWLSH
jgi:hypothetical protein